MAGRKGPVLHQNQNQNQNPNQNPNQDPNQVPGPNLPPDENPQNPLPPFNPFIPNTPVAPGVHQRPQLNWSHFKPEYTGKRDEDMKAHLLGTNDWMDTHEFLDQVKVQRFCLTLVGEARLWYESLRLININWEGLQNTFRQQYSKIGNTRKWTISCLEIISCQWEYGDNRHLCKLYSASCDTFRVPRTSDTRSF